jgi:hypothetical protein
VFREGATVADKHRAGEGEEDLLLVPAGVR